MTWTPSLQATRLGPWLVQLSLWITHRDFDRHESCHVGFHQLSSNSIIMGDVGNKILFPLTEEAKKRKKRTNYKTRLQCSNIFQDESSNVGLLRGGLSWPAVHLKCISRNFSWILVSGNKWNVRWQSNYFPCVSLMWPNVTLFSDRKKNTQKAEQSHNEMFGHRPFKRRNDAVTLPSWQLPLWHWITDTLNVLYVS